MHDELGRDSSEDALHNLVPSHPPCMAMLVISKILHTNAFVQKPGNNPKFENKTNKIVLSE